MAKQLSCQDAGIDCEFMIRSEDESELIEMVQQHARDVHDMEMSQSDVQDLIQTV
ncbi:MAG: DUF1059 domain-containing protein [Haloarculaceae archaeon]